MNTSSTYLASAGIPVVYFIMMLWAEEMFFLIFKFGVFENFICLKPCVRSMHAEVCSDACVLAPVPTHTSLRPSLRLAVQQRRWQLCCPKQSSDHPRTLPGKALIVTCGGSPAYSATEQDASHMSVSATAQFVSFSMIWRFLGRTLVSKRYKGPVENTSESAVTSRTN